MSNCIAFTDRKGERHSEGLGTNGSAGLLVQQFLVGYAAGRFPQSPRARAAVRLMGSFAGANPDYKGPGLFTTSEHVKAAIALDGEGCYWTEIDRRKVGIGWFSSPPTCPLYRGVLIPILLTSINDGAVSIAAPELAHVAKAWRTVLPGLGDSPAIMRLTKMTEMAERALEAGATRDWLGITAI